MSHERPRSRSKPLRDRRPGTSHVLNGASAHSPPEREKTSNLLRKYQQYGAGDGSVPPSYLDTDDKVTINVGVASSNKNGNERYFLTSYENTIEADRPEPPTLSMPNDIHQPHPHAQTQQRMSANRQRSRSARGSCSRSPRVSSSAANLQAYNSLRSLGKTTGDRRSDKGERSSHSRKNSQSAQCRSKVNNHAGTQKIKRMSHQGSTNSINMMSKKRPSSKQGSKKPPTMPDQTPFMDRNTSFQTTKELKDEAFNQQTMAKFMNDFNRMKLKMNVFITTQKDQEDKILHLSDKVDRLTAENIKLNADMRIMRDEHTEVLHQLF